MSIEGSEETNKKKKEYLFGRSLKVWKVTALSMVKITERSFKI